MRLGEKNCVPCRGGVPPLRASAAAEFLEQLDNWEAAEGHHLTKTFKFPDFKTALGFVNRIGMMAEEQNHHPDIYFAWGKVRIDVDAQDQWTDGKRFRFRGQVRRAVHRLTAAEPLVDGHMHLWILRPTGMGLRSEGGRAAATAQRFHAVKTDSSAAPSWFLPLDRSRPCVRGLMPTPWLPTGFR